jgi:nucleoside-diphosphate-sugar epimerase
VNGAVERHVLIVGCGYVGGRVATLEHAAGARVAALARSPESAQRLRELGVEPVMGDLDRPASLRALPAAGADLYYFAPPPSIGVSDPRLAALLASLPPENLPRRIVLISTTGVYGDCGGDWVDEDRPPNPQADRARRRFDAENRLRDFGARHDVETVILRVAGIYGPGRLPEERLRRGEPVLREEESPWSNRIHVDDLAQACVAAMRRGRDSAVYNATDGHPSTMTDYFNRVADALGLPRPPQVSLAETADGPSLARGPRLDPIGEARARMSEGMLSYLAESKRLDNRRLLEELGVQLMYPDLSSGLRAREARPGGARMEGE